MVDPSYDWELDSALSDEAQVTAHWTTAFDVLLLTVRKPPEVQKAGRQVARCTITGQALTDLLAFLAQTVAP